MISEDELPQREKTSSSSEPLSLLSLPDEIIENILARIPKWTYPNLSLVCKRFLSLLSSPQLYMTRFNLGTIEPCLYICIDMYMYTSSYSSPQWFSLSMRPQETSNGNGEVLNDFSLIPLPSSPHSPPRLAFFGSVAVGSDIYVIGGSTEKTSSVRILDCRSHTWRDAPNMTVARSWPNVNYLDEKIYVMNSYLYDEFANWSEVFDIKTQTWRALPSPCMSNNDRELFPAIRTEDGFLESFLVNPDVLDKKLYAASETKDYTYEPNDGTWKVVREESSLPELLKSCVIDNVMYSCRVMGGFKWYDSKGREWRGIKGLEGLCIEGTIIGMVNYGGKIVIMWSSCPEIDIENPKSQIRCARIALEKRHRDEIWGKTEWLNTVLEVPKSLYSHTCVAVLI